MEKKILNLIDNDKKTSFLFYPLFNFVFLLFYILNFDLPKHDILYDVILFLIFYCIFTVITFRKKLLIIKKINLLQISLFTFIFLFLFLEIVFKIKPNIFPVQLKNWIQIEKSNHKNKNVIEFLDKSPFVKFKSNVVIRNLSWRGNQNQFSYEWITDKNGFKNLKNIADLEKVEIVALGNSFTEGMGVKIEDTWPSKLSIKGYSTYNLGVQGYAPTQMYGSFIKFGKKLEPKLIIIGYLKGTFAREKRFFDTSKLFENKNFGPGIGQIAKNNENDEIRNQVNFVVSAVWIFTKNIRNQISNKFNSINSELSDASFNKYESEIIMFKNLKDFNPNENKSWKKTLSTFLKIKKEAEKIGAKTAILYFPSRPQVYLERALGQKLPINFRGKNELDLLENFSNKNGIIFINPTKKLTDYVNNLDESFTMEMLPYLEIDGHPSHIGYNLISDLIISNLKKN